MQASKARTNFCLHKYDKFRKHQFHIQQRCLEEINNVIIYYLFMCSNSKNGLNHTWEEGKIRREEGKIYNSNQVQIVGKSCAKL